MIYEKINEDLQHNMKSGNILLRDYIKVVKAELQRVGKTPSDEECFAVLKKLKKSAEENGNAQHEIDYVDTYLPKLMSEEEIIDIIDTLIQNGTTNIGPIMGYFNKNFKNKVDNNLVSSLVKLKLAKNGN